ncbi:hypothetical protein Leryth_008832 [Lithospermum erythrorhizon]|nr:hypothetical protein Leryth_008832 [Lithospermum erythrorhizon]
MAFSRMRFHLVFLETATFLCFFVSVVFSVTDPNDHKVLNEFRKGLENPELLKWPENGDDPCGPPSWPYVFCENGRVTQLQAKYLGLRGSLPQDLNKLSMLWNIGLQNNKLSGKLPSLSGLSKLKYVYLDFNEFDTIPSDFFRGLGSLEVMALDSNPLNATTGWSLPSDLKDSSQLANLTLSGCNLVGPLPEFWGDLPSLAVLRLSRNRIFGGIPGSLKDSMLRVLILNNQAGDGMTGPIDVVSTMLSLSTLWLYGNHFSGKIPENIGNLSSLQDLQLNNNDLVGLIPDSLVRLPLMKLSLDDNHFMGPIPKFEAVKVTYGSNSFCQPVPGAPCSPEVMALLGFLDGVNYQLKLAESWSGNNPCEGPWWGLSCNVNKKVSVINLPRSNLFGTLSPFSNLDSLTRIYLGSNNLSGPIPSSWSELKSLTLLDLSNNNISPPKPKFRSTVNVVLNGNSLFNSNASGNPPLKANSSTSAGAPMPSPTTGSSSSGSLPVPPSPTTGSSNSGSSPVPSSPSTNLNQDRTEASQESLPGKSSNNFNLVAIVAPVASFVILLFFVVPLSVYLLKKKKKRSHQPSSSIVIHPRDSSADPDNMVKIAVANNTTGEASTGSASNSVSRNSGVSHVIEAGNLVISVQVLRNVTKNFAPENELGRGGFGVVYKGELDDGTNIAVKRMESGVIGNKALDEFQSEIAVLSKVRHRHLVSLLGYSIEGNERILVYEYMPQGALSMHLFQRKKFKMEPLSWKRRLNIALDVARGIEYLHALAHQSFIHRDLKSSNILLGDDFRAKISDFGLVKLAPTVGEKSLVTRLAGTFGYLAPDFGVVLMELLTGMMALDQDRPEESQYLVSWFWQIKSDKEKLHAAIDPALEMKDEAFESMSTIAELAGHCTAREANQRPDMGHVVNVLSPLVEKWKPLDDDPEEYCGIDYSLPLKQMVKGWQDGEGKDSGYADLEDSKGSIPTRPTGFADSFTSTDGR